ncbi:MAG: NAD(P)-dependent oxidoreductase, partial [Anaerovoracaceae bacterium]
VVERMDNAEVVFFSKVNMTKELMDTNPNLKFLGITATGFDNFDVAAAKERGIACCNIPAYSTTAVAQHTIALLLELTNHVGLHDDSVQEGEWNEENGFCYWKAPLTLLAGKTMGIIGYGNIGRRVAAIAEALGMNIKLYREDPDGALACDVVSLHIPATAETEGFINKKTIAKMKDGAFLINTARGALIHEADLKNALISGKIKAYGTDVLSSEPPEKDHPLVSLSNCVITPHNAWSPIETREVVCSTCAANLSSFLRGDKLNRIDG